MLKEPAVLVVATSRSLTTLQLVIITKKQKNKPAIRQV